MSDTAARLAAAVNAQATSAALRERARAWSSAPSIFTQAADAIDEVVAALREAEARAEQAERELRAANEWAKTMEHERDYEQDVVSKDALDRLDEAQAENRKLRDALADAHAAMCAHGDLTDACTRARAALAEGNTP